MKIGYCVLLFFFLFACTGSSCFSKNVSIHPRPNVTYWADTTSLDIANDTITIYYKGRAMGSGADYELILHSNGEAVFGVYGFNENRSSIYPGTPLYSQTLNMFREYLEKEIAGDLLSREERETYREVSGCVGKLE